MPKVINKAYLSVNTYNISVRNHFWNIKTSVSLEIKMLRWNFHDRFLEHNWKNDDMAKTCTSHMSIRYIHVPRQDNTKLPTDWLARSQATFESRGSHHSDAVEAAHTLTCLPTNVQPPDAEELQQ